MFPNQLPNQLPADIRTLAARDRRAELTRAWARAAGSAQVNGFVGTAGATGTDSSSARAVPAGRPAMAVPGRARVALGRALQRAGDRLAGPATIPARQEA